VAPFAEIERLVEKPEYASGFSTRLANPVNAQPKAVVTFLQKRSVCATTRGGDLVPLDASESPTPTFCRLGR
jgi:hypothetical protein